jgi:hypothetical protein
MYRAITSGVLSESISMSDVKGNCSAEACKWEQYTTLAVCTSIEDVSSSIEVLQDANANGFAIARISGATWVSDHFYLMKAIKANIMPLNRSHPYRIY